MSNIAIKAENISKAYQLGDFGMGTVVNDFERWVAKVRGQEDPFLPIGESSYLGVRNYGDVVWSLRDINFEINQGDALGIIGRNGAGKSTLLKILSRVTSPTTGLIKIKGRVSSLLEVGTGFHPELSGRENIFLNGAILGMRKNEIKKQFDAIVDFFGAERYIDTPVKRYSSGMYVRLAFAVAAHLDSEILIVDEVLAVGDYEFQKKCLGKMKDISKREGRTVLFVSHNLGSIKSLCTKGMFLKNGLLQQSGGIDDVADMYMKDIAAGEADSHGMVQFAPELHRQAYITYLSLTDENGTIKTEFDVFEQVILNIKYTVREPTIGFSPLIDIKKDGVDLFYALLSDIDETVLDGQLPGDYSYKVKLHHPLKKGRYVLSFKLSKIRVGDVHGLDDVFTFYVNELSFDPTNKSYAGFRKGLVASVLNWERQPE